MSTPFSESFSSDIVELSAEEYCYTYEQAAQMTAVSVTLVERFVSLNLIEAKNAKLREPDIARIAQMLRLRRDLGLNWVGAGMVLDLSREISLLKARLRAFDSHQDLGEAGFH
ncbi:hypothetical protein IQ264_05190 [Phormidium sp. LEGE 05292]|uniref:chaperone modulator CbpM n=1 Tax=[Phormidium] sp. LEGE 05292 TaxID=767427 RepID=UPI0018815533|nr:chaperone modulator CbpM [Phormidium sp. LEGE 05292]MBE9224861.1 hypothetical protein [Phormidium sp. LEGE 05292]